jgi:hypothetical protein
LTINDPALIGLDEAVDAPVQPVPDDPHRVVVDGDMLLTKVKFAVACLLVAGLACGGLASLPVSAPAVAQPPLAAGKPASEHEALREENELLKVNLRVVLEKVRLQEAEIASLKVAGKATSATAPLAAARGQTLTPLGEPTQVSGSRRPGRPPAATPINLARVPPWGR